MKTVVFKLCQATVIVTFISVARVS